jgi:hypothetical protein
MSFKIFQNQRYKYIYYKYYSSFVKNMYLYKLSIHIEVLLFI